MLEKEFKPDMLYGKIVHYYMDKKGYNKTKANSIAQYVVNKETQRRICKSPGCSHFAHDHIRNVGTCLVKGCNCRAFASKMPTEPETQTAPTNTHKPEIVLN